jgi:hypothetical protein
VDPSGDITHLISEWQRGNKAAENALFEALYRRLHSKALHLLHSEPRRQSMGPTALVHEAYLRLERSERLEITDREHLREAGGKGDARHSGGPGAGAFYSTNSNRFSFIRSARTCAGSYCACCTSQLSALPPKTLDSLTAISGEMPRFPFTGSDSVVRVTPRAAAASVMLKA